ncbi:Transposase domain (DUF772) [Candidatus Electrothrix marina]|uniref:Transposase domain (DUF772) n=1 Tax=Candidatus Electrothrix marina TaxID=1859130 RepID=A0A444JH61_9BACT|nr:Transposase domain (DUF772) [Candidatus Electrothrix marina]
MDITEKHRAQQEAKRLENRIKCWTNHGPGFFRDHTRQILPVDFLALHFSANMGRPTNELVAMTGAMVLQQMHDLTDEEACEQSAFHNGIAPWISLITLTKFLMSAREVF